MTATARILSIATASPPHPVTQEEALRHLAGRFSTSLSARSAALMERLFSHTGVRTRRFGFDTPAAVFDESPDERMARFTRWSVDLACGAASAAMEKGGLRAGDIGGVVVNTCTGYLCPGISTYLVERLGLDRSVAACDLVGSGCGGAVPNLQTAAALSAARPGKPILSVAVEICSATFRMGDDPGLLVSNALFADGAAAAVVSPGDSGTLLLKDSLSRFLPEHREDIRFVYRDGQLYNQLSVRLPPIVGREAAALVSELLSRHGMTAGDVRYWAVHPGGTKVVDAVRDALGIPEELLEPSRRVLAEYGNMSSATVLFILDDMLRRGMRAGEHCLLLAFGAGMSLHAYLMKSL